ncbi:MAG: substrate binding domain-containing protein, partial [Pseudomonadota bacterium]
ALYERARRVLDDLEEMEKSVSAAREDPVGLLRISAPFSFGALDFSALITEFMAAHSGVDVDISFENRFVDPVAEGYDIVLRVGEPDEETTLVDHRVLLLEYYFCAGPGYLAARGAPERLGDLADHAVLYQRTSNAAPVFAAAGAGGAESVALAPVLTSNNLQTLLTAARAGLGVAVLPEYAVRSDLAEGALTRVLDGYALPQRMLQVVYPPARHLSAKVRVFTDYVETWCGVAP